MAELSKAEINNMLDKWFKQALAEDEEHRITREPLSELEHQSLSLEYSDLKRQMSADLAYSEYSRVAGYVDQMLEEQGINGDLDSVTYKALCREMLKKYVELLEVIERRERGEYRSPLASPAGTPTAQPGDPGPPLSEVIDHYLEENKKRLSAKAFQEYEAALRPFQRVVGNVPIKTLNRRKFSEFKGVLQKLPPNMNKLKRYRNKTIQQIVEMKIKKPLATNTIRKIMTRVSTLFIHAINNGFYEGANPADGMNIPKDRMDDEYRAPFSAEELERLFVSAEYLNDEHKHSFQFWCPIGESFKRTEFAFQPRRPDASRRVIARCGSRPEGKRSGKPSERSIWGLVALFGQQIIFI